MIIVLFQKINPIRSNNMSKKKSLKMQDEHPDVFDFSEMSYDDSSCEHESMGEIMSGLIEASNNQMMMAIELTKLIVANNPVDDMEQHVFSVFKNASKIIGENFALKNIMEQIEQVEQQH